MAGNTKTIDEHVGALLSGYIDGELTQQQRQWVEVHCAQCGECAQELDELTALRDAVGKSKLSQTGEDNWRETMNDPTVTLTRGIGWLLFIAGLLIAAGVGIYQFVFDSAIATWFKVVTVAVYGGLAVVFISVVRQRLIERKSDKYKDVEI